MKYSRWKIFSSDTRRATRGRWLIVSRRTDLDIIGKVVDGDNVGSVGIGIVANVIVAIILIGVGVVGVARWSGRALVISHRVSQG